DRGPAAAHPHCSNEHPVDHPGKDRMMHNVPYTERGTGRPFLVLHGGGGPQTVAGFADLLAAEHDAHVFTPIHPGFGGTPRPDSCTTVGDLARLYVALLDRLDLDDVTV